MDSIHLNQEFNAHLGNQDKYQVLP